jgi:hypothetical protein
MSVTTKLLGFLVAVLAVFGGAVGIGKAVGPLESTTSSGGHDGMDMGAGGEGGMAGMDMGKSAASAFPKGLMVSQNGYTFALEQTTASPGADVPVAFTIEGPDGDAVTEYDVEHEKELHLIAVRRDFSGFQHVHPVMDADGRWTTSLDLTSGQWRLFADFKATGAEAVTLGNDLAVPGDYEPVAPASDATTATVDGYTVTLDGDLTAGAEAKLTLTVTRDGRPVDDLEPYLGAYGHLVALRGGDLAYLHVHPEGTPGDGKTEPGPEVVFYANVPSPGRYHLYLDFKREGVVRTAAFTVTGTGYDTDESSGTGESADGHTGDEH